MSGIFDLIKRFPWLPSLEQYYSDVALKDPIDFINDILKSDKFNEINKRILNLFESALQNFEVLSEYQPDEINIYVYILLKILLYVLDNKNISNRIANLYSKTTYNELNKENEYNLYYIYRDLKLEVLYEEEPTIYKKTIIRDQYEILKTNFKIHFIDYLRLSSKLQDKSRKLINNPLSNGYVLIQTKNLNRLIQELVRMKFLNTNNKNIKNINVFKDKVLKNQEFKTIYEDILNLWETKKEDFEYTFEIGFKINKDISRSFPPCIKEILSKVKEGQNLNHTERLSIVWFLNALKYPEDEIINIFVTLPDFDRDKTGYQVRYAMKKGYTPYSCQTLKTYNLCMAKKYKDKLCLEGYFSKKLDVQKQISHPLFYVQYNEFVDSIKRKAENHSQPEKDE